MNQINISHRTFCYIHNFRIHFTLHNGATPIDLTVWKTEQSLKKRETKQNEQRSHKSTEKFTNRTIFMRFVLSSKFWIKGNDLAKKNLYKLKLKKIENKKNTDKTYPCMIRSKLNEQTCEISV